MKLQLLKRQLTLLVSRNVPLSPHDISSIRLADIDTYQRLVEYCDKILNGINEWE